MSLYEYLAAVVESDEVAHETADELEQELIDFIDEFWEFDH